MAHFRSATRRWKSRIKVPRAIKNSDVIADLLGSYIRSAFPTVIRRKNRAIFFDGESDRLTFISAYSQAMGGRGMA